MNVTLGRSDDCDIQLEDASASRHHARIVLVVEGWTVADQGSTNGVWIDGVPMTRGFLRNGDLLSLGLTIFKFVDDASAPPPEPTNGGSSPAPASVALTSPAPRSN